MRSLLCALLLATAASGADFSSASQELDQLIQTEIAEGHLPGAVLLIGHQGQILHRRAYGNRALEPAIEPMTVDTIFDCASLTKVVATTSSLMKLFEMGKLRLNERVTRYLPEFQGGRSEITVRNLLTHFSGLRPDLDLQPSWSGYQTGVHRALVDKPQSLPGMRFVYSDINFILLGEIVRRLSGQSLPEFARHYVFQPLGMRETMFRPPAELHPRIAPTERISGDAEPLRGLVHDETTRNMGGVAGHAGLFSTADDLARFCEMLLGKGERQGTRVFSPLTVTKFTTPQSPPDQPILRGLGWDLDSPFSGNRGELFPIGSYGHTGFTGTSIWMDPVTQTYVILLANSVHPVRRPAITALRGKVATITAAALDVDAPGVALTGYNETLEGAGVHRAVARNASVMTGIDVLESENFARFAGKRVGLITNHTGLDRQGRRNVDVMVKGGVNLVALYAPEHGYTGAEDKEDVENTKDAATGIPIWSLYAAKDRRPTDEMLRGVDALVFDVQDVGARFYTYTTTMAYAMEEAAKRDIAFYVLDRPNPVTGTRVEGPMLDRDKLSFVGYHPLPVRHGMTMGELARLFNEENHIGARLTVVTMKSWQRGDWFDSTGLSWVDLSPNMRSLNAALLYPGIAMLEYSKNLSVGRGTDAPFEQVGADFIHGTELAAWMNRRYIPGVRVYPTRFRPSASYFANRTIEGVRFVITDRERFDATRLGLEVAAGLQKLYPGKLVWDVNKKLIGSQTAMNALAAGEDARAIQQREQAAVEAFLPVRAKYLLY